MLLKCNSYQFYQLSMRSKYYNVLIHNKTNDKARSFVIQTVIMIASLQDFKSNTTMEVS